MRSYIAIFEENPDNNAEIAAIGQLIADKTEDEESPSKLKTESFIGLINKMGIPLTKDALMDMVEAGNLSEIISDMNDEEVFFKGQGAIDTNTMNVDKAEDIVDKMAKRQAKKGIRK